MLAPERCWVWVTQLHPSTQGVPGSLPPCKISREAVEAPPLPASSSLGARGTAIPTSVSKPLPQDSYGQGAAPPPTTYVRGVASLGYTPPAIGGGVGWARNLAFQMCLATPTLEETLEVEGTGEGV